VDYTALSPEALVLVCSQSGNVDAWEEFVRRFHRLIATVVLRTARRWNENSPQVIDDLVQETYLKICADGCSLLRDFQPAHKDSIYGYIKVITANLVHDHFKASRSQKRRGDAATDSMEEVEGSEPMPLASKSVVETVERNILFQEIDACLRSIGQGPNADRDRRIFWLYYRLGLAASAIASLPTIGLSTKGVESTLLRLTRHVRQQFALGKQSKANEEGKIEGIRPGESF
jgi:RNA polymerase sigma-70 factor (ECF subfamily)